MAPKAAQGTSAHSPSLTPCDFCGRSHKQGSARERACSSLGRPGTNRSSVKPPSSSEGLTANFAVGEFSRRGEGERPRGEPSAHPVFSRQMLPRGVESAPQDSRDRVPESSEDSKRLAGDMRAAARSAVSAWKDLGVSPTQAMMSDMDVFPEEVEELLESHSDAVEESSQKMGSIGLSVSSLASSDSFRRQCFHAVRTAKGLAVSPVTVQRVLARAMGGSPYDSKEMVKASIFLRAIAERSDEVKALLRKPADEVTASDVRPVVNLLSNIGHLRSGRVRVSGYENRDVLPEFNRGCLSRLSSSDFDELSKWCDAVSESTSKTVLPTDDLRGTPALPISIGEELVAHDLDYGAWCYYGWEDGEFHSHSAVILEPELVKMRKDGIPDDILVSLRPEVLDQDSDYRYSSAGFLGHGDGRFAVAGTSSLGARNFGEEGIEEKARAIKERSKRLNVR